MTYKILLVDDSKTQLNQIHSILSGNGYDIFLAESGNEAVSLLINSEEKPDLIISDTMSLN